MKWVLKSKGLGLYACPNEKPYSTAYQKKAQKFSSVEMARQFRFEFGYSPYAWQVVKLVPKNNDKEYVLSYSDGQQDWFINVNGCSVMSKSNVMTFPSIEEARAYSREHFLAEWKVVELVSEKEPDKKNKKWFVMCVSNKEPWCINIHGCTFRDFSRAMIFDSAEKAEAYISEHLSSHSCHWEAVRSDQLESKINALNEYTRGYNDALNDIKQQINQMETK